MHLHYVENYYEQTRYTKTICRMLIRYNNNSKRNVIQIQVLFLIFNVMNKVNIVVSCVIFTL